MVEEGGTGSPTCSERETPLPSAEKLHAGTVELTRCLLESGRHPGPVMDQAVAQVTVTAQASGLDGGNPAGTKGHSEPTSAAPWLSTDERN